MANNFSFQEKEVEDIEIDIEKFRKMTTLKDTLFFLSEKLQKHQKGDGYKDDESKTESFQESSGRIDWTQDPVLRNAWIKDVLAQSKDSDILESDLRPFENGNMEGWNVAESPWDVQVQETLTPEEQEGS